MAISLISLSGAVRAVVGALVLVVGAIVVANVLGSGLAFVGFTLWLLTIVLVGAGVMLIARAGRPVAGAGAIVTALSLWLAFQYELPAILWTIVFLVGIGLIVRGTAEDSLHVGAWVLLIPRVMFGWAWIDNAQDHFRSGWLPGGGGGYSQLVNGAAGRPASYFLDPLYQGFLKGAVAPNVDLFAALTLCGELTFGTLLAVGLLTPVAEVSKSVGVFVPSSRYKRCCCARSPSRRSSLRGLSVRSRTSAGNRQSRRRAGVLSSFASPGSNWAR